MKKIVLFFAVALFAASCTQISKEKKDSTKEVGAPVTGGNEALKPLLLDVISMSPKTRESASENSDDLLEQANAISNVVVDTLTITKKDIPNEKMVDLGLGVCWAGCNLGASTPVEAGSFFSYDVILTFDDSPSDADIVYAELEKSGKGWRLPTEYEIDELGRRCEWIWCRYVADDNSYIYGYKVVGPNNKFIFIPAEGVIIDETRYLRGERCVLMDDGGVLHVTSGHDPAIILEFGVEIPVYNTSGIAVSKKSVIRPVMSLK